MSETTIYQDLAERTGGSFLLGVVGPVRTGKSSFIKRMMEIMVIPYIEDPYARERAIDELPQSGSGKTIMTVEPKFIPEEAAAILLDQHTELNVRMIDCVGYMVDGITGQFEDGAERMVTTPWFDHEVTMSEAAEKGTEKVIRDHSSIGIVITTDGSFGDLSRDTFVEAERRVIRELQELGKPFVVILNSAHPSDAQTMALTDEISESYDVRCLCMDCLSMSEGDVKMILKSILEDFPLRSLGFYMPDWIDALPDQNTLKKALMSAVKDATQGLVKIRDIPAEAEALEEHELISQASITNRLLGMGAASLRLSLPRSLYYQTLSEETGLPIENDGDLIETLSSMAAIRADYEKLRKALADVRETGYGVVFPDPEQMVLEEPKIVRQNGKYGVKLRASAPAIHLLMTQVETEVNPAIGGENASEDIIGFLLQGFDGDVNRIWESNIFGRSLNELAEEALRGKIDNLPENARMKLKNTLQRIINEGSSGLICILL